MSLELKAFIRKLDHETSDLKFLNNQYVHKVRALEKDSKSKTERIQQLQEKNTQAVVQTPGRIVTPYLLEFFNQNSSNVSSCLVFVLLMFVAININLKKLKL